MSVYWIHFIRMSASFRRVSTPPPPYYENVTTISSTTPYNPSALDNEVCQYDVSDDVYILATDADTEFSGGSMRTLLDLCESDQSLGAVCGRTTPVGAAKPVVWYQKFEYAKGRKIRFCPRQERPLYFWV
jgi:hypothetical protein